MRKEIFEGKVTYDRTSDTGDPWHDFEYMIGNYCQSEVVETLQNLRGKNVRITIEEIPDEQEKKETEE